MSRLPQPPAPAALKALLRPHEDVVAVHSGTRLVRVFAAGGRHEQRWNTFRTTGPLAHARFDPQPPRPGGGAGPSEEGVLYFGLSVRTSVAEVYQQTSIVDRTTRRPHLVVFQPRRTLRLLDLTGLWPTRAGASQEISSGPKDVTQAWARAIRAAHPRPGRPLVPLVDGLRRPRGLPVGPAGVRRAAGEPGRAGAAGLPRPRPAVVTNL